MRPIINERIVDRESEIFLQFRYLERSYFLFILIQVVRVFVSYGACLTKLTNFSQVGIMT